MKEKSTGEQVLHYIVQVVAFNQPISLQAWVHGCPAILSIQVIGTVFHVLPDWLPLHWHWVFVWQEQQLAHLVHYNPLIVQKLACKISYFMYRY